MHKSVPQNHPLAPWVGTTEEAGGCALDGLQAAGELLLTHFVATGTQGFDGAGRETFFFQQGGAVE